MDYSRYQLAVFDWIGSPLAGAFAAVDSVAGSGKTFTGVKGLERAPGLKLFTCYNRGIREDLEKKTKHLHQCKISTYNSLGWGACMNALRSRKPQLVQEKTENSLRSYIGRGSWELSDVDFRIYSKIKGPITKLVSLGKGMCLYSPDEFLREVPELIDFHDLEVPDQDAAFSYNDFIEALRWVYYDTTENTRVMDFDDQIFQPLRMGLNFQQYDFIMVDEYQDTNKMQAAMMDRCLRRGGRMMVFGDDDQCIYEFRGALPDTMKHWIEEKGAIRLPLSICYRCPKAVIREAQKIVSRIEWSPEAKEGYAGEIAFDDYMKRVRDGDFVLCRTSAELVGDCLKFIQQGRKASVRGKEIGDQLVAVVNAVTGGSDCGIIEFAAKFKDWTTERRERLGKLGREAQLEKLDQKVETIEVFLEEVSSTKALIAKINSIFDDNPSSGIQLMTSHKSKGLQNPNVWIRAPEKLDDNWHVTRDWMRGSQRRLKYVSQTRAQENLFYVSSPKKAQEKAQEQIQAEKPEPEEEEEYTFAPASSFFGQKNYSGESVD